MYRAIAIGAAALVALIVVTAIAAGGALAVVVGLLAAWVALLVLPIAAIHWDEDETTGPRLR